MKKTDRKRRIAEIRLKNFLIAQMEVEINGRCTIMGKTFTKNDLAYMQKRINILRQEVEGNVRNHIKSSKEALGNVARSRNRGSD